MSAMRFMCKLGVSMAIIPNLLKVFCEVCVFEIDVIFEHVFYVLDKRNGVREDVFSIHITVREERASILDCLISHEADILLIGFSQLLGGISDTDRRVG